MYTNTNGLTMKCFPVSVQHSRCFDGEGTSQSTAQIHFSRIHTKEKSPTISERGRTVTEQGVYYKFKSIPPLNMNFEKRGTRF